MMEFSDWNSFLDEVKVGDRINFIFADAPNDIWDGVVERREDPVRMAVRYAGRSNSEYTFDFSNPSGHRTMTQFRILNRSQKDTMSKDILDFYQDINASDDDLLLKELGLENPVGVPTQKGLDLSQKISYQNNRKEIVEIAKKLKSREDGDEKKGKKA